MDNMTKFAQKKKKKRKQRKLRSSQHAWDFCVAASIQNSASVIISVVLVGGEAPILAVLLKPMGT